MMIKQTLIGAAVLVYAGNVFSQNPHLNFKNSLVMYNHSTFVMDRSVPSAIGTTSLVYTDSRTTFLHPTIAFRWRTGNQNFQEIELTKFSMNSVDLRVVEVDANGSVRSAGGNINTATDIQARYEFLQTFNKRKEKKLVPSVGFGVKPGFRRMGIKYHGGSSFPASISFFSAEVQIIPRLTYFLKEKLFVDLNIPLSVLYLQLRSDKRLDPSLPVNSQRYTTFDLELIPAMLSARLGVGITL